MAIERIRSSNTAHTSVGSGTAAGADAPPSCLSAAGMDAEGAASGSSRVQDWLVVVYLTIYHGPVFKKAPIPPVRDLFFCVFARAGIALWLCVRGTDLVAVEGLLRDRYLPPPVGYRLAVYGKIQGSPTSHLRGAAPRSSTVEPRRAALLHRRTNPHFEPALWMDRLVKRPRRRVFAFSIRLFFPLAAQGPAASVFGLSLSRRPKALAEFRGSA